MSFAPEQAAAPATPLLEAAKAGDAAAWRELFDLFAPAVGGYLRVQGVRDVDDLVSEVFIGVFRRIGAFHGSMEQFRSWVFVIAHHKLIDDRRRQGRSLADSLTEIDEVPEPNSSADAESTAMARMSEARVVELCGRLAADQRDVLLLRLVGDLTIEHIADTLGKSIGAVKALQRRGLAALNRILSMEGVPL